MYQNDQMFSSISLGSRSQHGPNWSHWFLSESGVYLLHFSRPFHHAQHYIGFVHDARQLSRRIHQHETGRGSKLCAAAAAAGITFTLAGYWPGDRRFERRLKNYKKARCLCAICRAEREVRTNKRAAATGQTHFLNRLDPLADIPF